MGEINTCSVGLRLRESSDDLYVCEKCVEPDDVVFENLPVDKESQELCGQFGGPLYMPYRP